ELQSVIADWCDRHKNQLPFQNWSHPRDYHLTLNFLGETAPETGERIGTALAEIAAYCNPFSLRLGKIGYFGASASPKVLHMDIEGDLSEASRLQKSVEAAVEPLGFPKETRPFHPHITLARKYIGIGRLSAEDAFAHAPGSDGGDTVREWIVRNIVLYQSHLGRKPMYEAIKVIPLNREKE
ncbi:MAG: 2-5 ligase, partial [Paenibacillaceae bacterium]|nr:2-5 ligase [Paenibacillaceae bacterium]